MRTAPLKLSQAGNSQSELNDNRMRRDAYKEINMLLDRKTES